MERNGAENIREFLRSPLWFLLHSSPSLRNPTSILDDPSIPLPITPSIIPPITSSKILLSLPTSSLLHFAVILHIVLSMSQHFLHSSCVLPPSLHHLEFVIPPSRFCR